MKMKLICLMLIIVGVVSCKKDQHSITPESISQINDSSKNLSKEQVKD